MGNLKVRVSLYGTIADKEYWNFYLFPTVEIVRFDGYWEDNVRYPTSIDLEWLCFCVEIKIGRKEE